jgi:hypothetical protein
MEIPSGQLARSPSMKFSWEGKAEQYRFALYGIDGGEIIPPVITFSNSYTMGNLSLLKEGTYVWQVYEMTTTGTWSDFPSVANQFTVVNLDIPPKVLPTSNPGELYGKR